MGLFSKLSDSLSKTRKGFVEKVFDTFTGKEIDDDLYDELEEVLIQGDVGVVAVEFVDDMRKPGNRDAGKCTDVDRADIQSVQLGNILIQMVVGIDNGAQEGQNGFAAVRQ